MGSTDRITTLYRRVGQAEFDLIRAPGFLGRFRGGYQELRQ